MLCFIKMITIVAIIIYIIFSFASVCWVFDDSFDRKPTNNLEKLLEIIFYPSIKLGEWFKKPLKGE